LRKIIIFSLLLLKHIDTALFKQTSFIRNRFFYHSLSSGVPISSTEKIWSLKNDIIYCFGEWEIMSLEEERGEDENENDRFTNASFFI